MKQKEVPEMDDVEEIISKISEDSPYKRRPTQKRTWMTAVSYTHLDVYKRQEYRSIADKIKANRGTIDQRDRQQEKSRRRSRGMEMKDPANASFLLVGER